MDKPTLRYLIKEQKYTNGFIRIRLADIAIRNETLLEVFIDSFFLSCKVVCFLLAQGFFLYTIKLGFALAINLGSVK